jgi:hypothetical protein
MDEINGIKIPLLIHQSLIYALMPSKYFLTELKYYEIVPNMLKVYTTNARYITTVATKHVASWLAHNGYALHHYAKKGNDTILIVTKV